MERPKRFIKKSQKALEAAEMERIFLEQVNLKKRKGRPPSLLDKPEACNVSVASELGWEESLRKSAEMTTDRKKEGKENEAPMKLSLLINMPHVIEDRGTDSKCQVGKSHVVGIKRQKCELAGSEDKGPSRSLVGSESTSCMPKMTKLTADRPAVHAKLALGLDAKLSSSSKKDNQLMETLKQPSSRTKQAEENQNCLVHSQIEGIEGDKMLGNHVPEVGLTKSYCIIKEEVSQATNQGLLERSVLNSSVKLVRGETSYHRKLNQHERVMLQCEEDMYELDMVIKITESTIRQTTLWMDDINCGSRKQMHCYFNGSNRRCIEKLYGNRGVDFLEALQEKPQMVLPVLLERLKQKVRETKNYRLEHNHAMVHVFYENFKDSLNFRSLPTAHYKATSEGLQQ